MIAGVIQRFNIPVATIGIVLGIDRILDMSRTVLNVTGDMAIAACVAKWEGEPTAVPEEARE
jgi:DAACS family dicarboxylate/amino acid:cation (Na+ or H+) symporter